MRFSFLKSELAPRFYAPLVLLIAAIYARFPLTGADDFWAHAAIGRWIWQHGQIPQQTLFIWGSEPVHWIAHSWLSQWMFFVWMEIGGEKYGPYVVVACSMFLVALTFGVLWHVWKRQSRLTVLTPFLFLFVIWLSAPRFHPRPELFTALFLALLLWFLIEWHPEYAPRNSSSQVLVTRLAPFNYATAGAIIFLFALWTNFHGAVAFGLTMLVLMLGADGLQDRFDARWRRLLLLAILCLLATLLNPYGTDYWEALRAVNSRTFRSIDEWKRPWANPAVPTSYIIGEVVLALVTLLAWWRNPQRRWAHALWTVFMLASFLNARRNLWMTALVCLAVLAANARALDSEILWREWRALTQRTVPPSPIPAGLRAVARWGAVLCLFVGLLMATPRNFLHWRAVPPQRVPEGMAQFVLGKGWTQARIFNDYEYSSYWQWRFAGHPPLYIDLLNAYPDQLLVNYFDVLRANPRGRRILDGQNPDPKKPTRKAPSSPSRRIDVVLLRQHKKTETALNSFAGWLDRQPNWQRVYSGYDGKIWQRKHSQP